MEDAPKDGIAIVCRLDGEIVEIVHDDLDLRLEAGSSFFDLAEGPGRTKCQLFMTEVKARGAAYRWELHLRTRLGFMALHFTGGRKQDTALLLGLRDPEAVERLYEDLTVINNEQVNQLRLLMKDQMLRQSEKRHDGTVYDDLTKLNNELASTQRELTKKNIQLEQLNQQKNQLLGMAAHDLRTPLGIIETYSDFLLEDGAHGLTGEPLEFLQTIKSSSQFMLRMVNDLLDLSKIEAGELQLDRSSTDLVSLVRRNVSLNLVFAQRKDIDIQLTTEAGLEPFDLDAAKMEQVLNNLLSNAIKYSNPHTCVRVRLDRKDDEVILSVADEGQGIAADEMSALFQAFKRTSAKTTAGESSTGLGLAICRRIVDGHGGRIWAESELGKGTTFYLALHYEPTTLTEAPQPQDGSGPLHVLVAEDNAIARKLVGVLLGRLGHSFTLTEDGQQAVEAAAAETYDVVLMDVEMPVMNGLVATASLKALLPTLPVVGLTAHTSDEEANRCLDAGMVDVVTKPIRRPALEAALIRACTSG